MRLFSLTASRDGSASPCPDKRTYQRPAGKFPESVAGHTTPVVPRARQLTFESTKMPWFAS